MRYEERVIDEVQSLNDIVEVISGYLPLKRAGRTFKALCPFHQEKTPSFIVHPEKQIFHCFGCGAGGNVISFLMKYENTSFPEALRNLAERAHYQLPEPSGRSPKEVSESESLYEVYRLAQEYYFSNMKHPQKGEAARNYLVQRGFGVDLLEEFPLGWATSDWRGLLEFLVKRGVQENILFLSGLILRSREGNPYDLFRSRLLFPIMNAQGKVVAFGGRGLSNETPKYLNSPESPIFRKRKELYGLHLAKRFVTPSDSRILIVEGYFDFLRVYRSGFKNVVATLGTSLTEEHVRIIRRYVQEAVVIFDGDAAGESAAIRGLEVFLEGEISVKVVALPAGKDPDSLIKEKGAEEFKKYLDQAKDFFDFKWHYLTRFHRVSDSAGLLKISNEFMETFSKIKSPLLLDRYLKRLTGLLGVEENSLRTELVRRKQKTQIREMGAEQKRPDAPSFLPHPEEGILIALLLGEPGLWKKMEELITPQDFKNPDFRQAFQIIKTCYEYGANLTYQQLFNRLENEAVKMAVTAYSVNELSINQKEKAFLDCVSKMRQKWIRERLAKLRQAIQDAEGEGEKEKITELLQEYQSLLATKG